METLEGLLDRAESEPLLPHRTGEVRALLHACMRLLDGTEPAALAGRVLTRLAHLKMLDGDLDAADELLARAHQRWAEAPAPLAELSARALGIRVRVRRRDLDGAREELRTLTAQFPDVSLDSVPARRAAIALSLASAEILAANKEELKIAAQLCRRLIARFGGDQRFAEATFTCGQILLVA
jgi:hypothetical protein